ncbi:MAG: LuxR C-terminal-related transcriptional regulator [Gammaproteobacteria bacterium]|nr:LuxR C-terminal-related transcriptional regulator [Gammaproteobacteria bacterium]
MIAIADSGEFRFVPGKVRVPEATPFHLERPNLLGTIEGNDWTIVALTAPAGFGKTTLLAELCRRARDRNRVAAWLTVDERDTVASAGLYLAAAFEQAGLAGAGNMEPPASALPEQIERHGKPCLLVVDEVERIAPPVVKALAFLVHNAPENLRIAIGMRHDPGLDLSPIILGGRGVVFNADWLRFSSADIEAYFGNALSQRRLAEVTRATAGWPIAVNLVRHGGSARSGVAAMDAAPFGADESLAANWLESRLFADNGKDRDFVMDIGQFDWIDPDIVDEALGIDDSARRLAALVALEGLVAPDGDGGRARLHELVRWHCVRTLRGRNPERYREVHGAIARALAGRGQIDVAAGHAKEAGDAALVGEVYSRGGGLALLLREGMAGRDGVLDLLTEDVIELYPRLALMRCRLLVYEARLQDARVLFERTRTQTADFTRDRSAADAEALRLEASYVEAILVGFGCMEFDFPEVDRCANSYWQATNGSVDPAVAAALASVLHGTYQMRAMFDRAHQYGRAALTTHSEIAATPGIFHVNLQMGIVAMARGLVAQAEQRYGLAASIAADLNDRRLCQVADVLLAELHLECNRIDAAQQVADGLRVTPRNGAMWLDIIVAAHDLIAWRRFDTGGVDAALEALQMCHDACETQGMPAACRQLAGSRIAYLVFAGRVEQALGDWSVAGLPALEEDILRLDRQSWREMETLACARVRLLTASGRFAEARHLAAYLEAVAEERGLVRTLLRCRALAMVLEHRAGRAEQAAAHLLAYLARFTETEFSAPLIRDPDACRILPELLAGVSPDPEIEAAVESLLRQRGDILELATPQFTLREREIIVLLGKGLRDKEIARGLSLSVHGVRFHLRNIYRKTGASNRAEAVNRATREGIVERP